MLRAQDQDKEKEQAEEHIRCLRRNRNLSTVAEQIDMDHSNVDPEKTVDVVLTFWVA